MTSLVESHTAEWMAQQGSTPGTELHRDPDATWLVQPGAAWSNAAAGLRLVDDIIEPAETRGYIVNALEALVTKHEWRPQKKHGLIPL